MTQTSLIERTDGNTAYLDNVSRVAVEEGALYVISEDRYTTVFAPGAWLTVTTIPSEDAPSTIGDRVYSPTT